MPAIVTIPAQSDNAVLQFLLYVMCVTWPMLIAY